MVARPWLSYTGSAGPTGRFDVVHPTRERRPRQLRDSAVKNNSLYRRIDRPGLRDRGARSSGITSQKRRGRRPESRHRTSDTDERVADDLLRACKGRPYRKEGEAAYIAPILPQRLPAMLENIRGKGFNDALFACVVEDDLQNACAVVVGKPLQLRQRLIGSKAFDMARVPFCNSVHRGSSACHSRKRLRVPAT